MLIEIFMAMQLNNTLIAEYNMDSNLPALRRPENAYPSGLEFKDESFVKYGPPSTDDPVLLIIDPIFDKEWNYIVPGYYQLTLDSGREVMYLIQSGKIVATIPVFKVEIDKKKDAKKRKNQVPRNFFKRQIFKFKRFRKEHKRREDIKKKRIEPETKIYSDATIELVENEKYYLIKYEKEAVKAWGFLKYR